MKKGLTVMMAAFFLVLMLGGNSQALTISGSIWYAADAASQNPGAGPPAGLADATFTVQQLNFNAPTGPVTYGNFLSGGGSNGLVWVSDPTNLAGTNMHTSPGTGTFFQFVWTQFVTTGTLVSVLHDDGFSLQVGGVLYDYSTPTTPLLSQFNITNPDGTYTFTLNYGAYNSYPEVLQARVPEPMSLLLLGLGMLGVAVLRRK